MSTSTHQIPSANPAAANARQEQGLHSAIRRVLESGQYILGTECRHFEEEFGLFCGDVGCVSVANGTDALAIALQAAGLRPGDGVLVPSLTASATGTAVRLAGGRLLLADCCPDTLTMCPESARACLSAHQGSRPRFLVPVHLYGQPCAMEELSGVARDFGCTLIEDAAQAHGARYGGQMVGTLGTAAAFSFYPTKNLGAIGDAGALTSADSGLLERALLLRQYGWRERYVSSEDGINSRMDEIQAAILRVKLASLEIENERRRTIATLYREGLNGSRYRMTREPAQTRCVYHQFTLRHVNRDACRAFLERKGIGTALLYPAGLHQQPAFARDALQPPKGLPATEEAVQRLFCLPMYPDLDDISVKQVIQALLAFPD